jgi:hypothetical protein
MKAAVAALDYEIWFQVEVTLAKASELTGDKVSVLSTQLLNYSRERNR